MPIRRDRHKTTIAIAVGTTIINGSNGIETAPGISRPFATIAHAPPCHSVSKIAIASQVCMRSDAVSDARKTCPGSAEQQDMHHDTHNDNREPRALETRHGDNRHEPKARRNHTAGKREHWVG